MSEKTEKMTVELKEEDRNLLKSVIERLGNVEAPPKTDAKTHAETHVAHETIKDVIECPDCYPQVKKLVLPKVWEETKDLSHECTECGLGVKGEESEKEDWECPTCGSKTARERSR